jgi:hypothetical protein
MEEPIAPLVVVRKNANAFLAAAGLKRAAGPFWAETDPTALDRRLSGD